MSNLLIPALVLCERWREEVREARRRAARRGERIVTWCFCGIMIDVWVA